MIHIINAIPFNFKTFHIDEVVSKFHTYICGDPWHVEKFNKYVLGLFPNVPSVSTKDTLRYRQVSMISIFGVIF